MPAAPRLRRRLPARSGFLLAVLATTAGGLLGAAARAQDGVPSPTSLPTTPGIGAPVSWPKPKDKTDDDLPPMGLGFGTPVAAAPASSKPTAKRRERLAQAGGGNSGMGTGGPASAPPAFVPPPPAPDVSEAPTAPPAAQTNLRSTPIVEPLPESVRRTLAERARAAGAPDPRLGPTDPRPFRPRLAKGAPMRGGKLATCLNSDFFSVPTDRKGMLATDPGRYGYGIGYEFVESIADLRKQHWITDDALKAGINDALLGRRTLVSAQERLRLSEQLSEKFRSTNRQEVSNAMMMLSAKNQAAADAFLEANKAKPGVTTTASGLQYEVLADGSGPKPAATDTVTVHYRGTLENGTEFDSSYSRGTPATFPLNRVIPGWTEGVQLMNVGSRYRFFIPPALGYGSRGAGGKIGPNALLIFEVELLKIN